MRNSSLELLRLISIVLITSMHCFSQIEQPLLPVNQVLGVAINSIGNIGVTTFILISGYFGIRFNLFRIVQLALLTTVCSLMVYLTNYGFVMNKHLFMAALIVPMYNQWFIACYIVLMALSGYINKFVESLDRVSYRKLLFICFVLFSLIPAFFVFDSKTIIVDGGKNLTYFIFLYIVGRFIRRYDITISSRNLHLVFAVTFLSIFISNYLLECYFGFKYFFSRDCNPLNLFLAISVFLMFKARVFYSKSINNIAQSVLTIYLLNNTRVAIDQHVLCWSDKGASVYCILYLACGIFTVIFFSILFDKFRVLCLAGLENWIVRFFCNRIRLLKKFLENAIQRSAVSIVD